MDRLMADKFYEQWKLFMERWDKTPITMDGGTTPTGVIAGWGKQAQEWSPHERRGVNWAMRMRILNHAWKHNCKH